MSKRPKAAEVDESLIIQSFKDEALLEGSIISPPQEEINEDCDTTTVKSKSRRRRGTYKEVFLKKKEIRTRQPVYISQNIHERILKLVRILALGDKGISVGGYIDNVLADHLEQNKDEIEELKKKFLENI